MDCDTVVMCVSFRITTRRHNMACPKVQTSYEILCYHSGEDSSPGVLDYDTVVMCVSFRITTWPL
jgi:hypothetical protein